MPPSRTANARAADSRGGRLVPPAVADSTNNSSLRDTGQQPTELDTARRKCYNSSIVEDRTNRPGRSVSLSLPYIKQREQYDEDVLGFDEILSLVAGVVVAPHYACGGGELVPVSRRELKRHRHGRHASR